MDFELTREQEAVRAMAREWALAEVAPVIHRYDEAQEFPREILASLGKTGLLVDLPDGFRYRILEARSARSLPDADAALEAAMDAPAGCPPLVELARGKRTAANAT